MKRIAFTIFTIFLALMVTAKDYNHELSGRVQDAVFGDPLAAKLTLMTSDSVVIDTVTAVLGMSLYSGGQVAGYGFRNVPQKGKYIIRAVMDGYFDAYLNCEIISNRQERVELEPILMRKAFVELPEVSVNATKVKMVMRGDTIVYNADAFNLAEGSMLDALVSRLPGAKLTRDGRIYVNNKKIQSLLIDGHDFFEGNPQIALQNLPAYTVKNIKVYDKAGQASRLMGTNMGDQTYVMDVRLKKEYAKGYMANVEAGLGTHHRYKTRGMATNFSEKSRFFGVFNINNLNDRSEPNVYQEWEDNTVPTGRLATKNASLGYVNYLNGEKEWISSSFIYKYAGSDDETRTNTQTFLPGGDTFTSNTLKNLSSQESWQNHNFFLSEYKGGSTANDVSWSHSRSHGLGKGLTETGDSLSLYNRMLMANSSESSSWNVNAFSNNGWKVFVVDMLHLYATFNYDHSKQHSFALNDVNYLRNATRDYRDNYRDESSQNTKLQISPSYTYITNGGNCSAEYEYTHNYNKTSNLLYRLDKLADRDSSLFDLLPSAVDALASVLDHPNSYSYREYRNEHKVNLRSYYWKNGSKYSYEVNLPIRVVNANLYYDRMGEHHVRRNSVFFEPNFYLERGVYKFGWKIGGKMYSEFPELTSMVNYRDDSDPLNIRLGNSELLNTHHYEAEASITFRSEHQQSINLWTDFHQIDNAVAYALTFDKQQGISTTQPVSVNGNRSANGGVSFSRAIDKKETLMASTELWVNYNHNVDMATVEGYASSQRSIVNNYKMGGNAKLNYRPNDDYEFTLHGNGNYYLIRSERVGFQQIHAGEYNVGMNAVMKLPWEFQFSSDMTMFARRGYQQKEMNTTNWVWNAQLSRSFFKGALMAKLQGYDILNELSTTQYAMNAQGRTETWQNSIPSYVMLSLSWRVNVAMNRKK